MKKITATNKTFGFYAGQKPAIRQSAHAGARRPFGVIVLPLKERKLGDMNVLDAKRQGAGCRKYPP